MRPLASWAVLGFLVTACSGPAPAALQPRPFNPGEIGWSSSYEKSTLEISGRYQIMGAQRELAARVSFGSSSREPLTGWQAGAEGIAARVEHEGRILPTRVTVTVLKEPATGVWERHGRVELRVVLDREDGEPFPHGSNLVALDVADFLNALKYPDGTPWSGKARLTEQKTVFFKAVETPRELAKFHLIEGFHALDSQNFPEATEHLKEVLRLEPGTLTAQCGLGRAYVEQGIYVEAIGPLEDAFSAWPAFRQIYTEAREFPELLPLVRALVATGNEARATEVLLASGSSLPQASAEVARHKRALGGK
jgi:hypothetical protein